jgi:hypothetical protein
MSDPNEKPPRMTPRSALKLALEQTGLDKLALARIGLDSENLSAEEVERALPKIQEALETSLPPKEVRRGLSRLEAYLRFLKSRVHLWLH